MLYSRRLFLTRGMQMLSVAATVPAFLDRSAFCLAADHAENPQGAGRPDHILVVVQLAGGNDGLNTVVPIGNDDYYRARPVLGIPKEKALRLTDDFGVHPNAAGLKKIYDAGYLTILNAVGYPNPNRSHFRSTDIWTSAHPETVAKDGWLGKFCDACCGGADPAPAASGERPGQKSQAPDPATAIALDVEPPAALVGKTYIPLTFRAPDNLAYRFARDAKSRTAFDKLNGGLAQNAAMDAIDDDDHRPPPAMPMGTNGSLQQNDQAASFIQRSALNARLYASRIQKYTASIQNAGAYPATGFAQDLKLVAQMIASDLPTRVYYVKLGGFDTHSNQLARHEKLMTEFAGGLAAFIDDLKSMGNLDRTTVMTFSEFGRRVADNGSGTDHGEAAPLFIAGGRTRPGFMGTFPSLAAAKLHRGDVPYTTDFRSLYATILKEWLRTDPVAILGQPFKTLDLFRNA
jgi:uncharacterized protein (DUF1501 family)